MRMRKKRRCAERMTALSDLFIEPGAFSDEIFEKKRPLRLEIGCGKGDFICALAKREPDFNYIAVEKVSDVAVVAAEKYASSIGLGGLNGVGAWETPNGEEYNGTPVPISLENRGNVRFLCCDAAILADILPHGEFDGIFANFSDPWPKKGYHNRRLTHPDFLKRYLLLLKQGGKFRFKTDNTELFDFSLEALNCEENFLVTFVSRDLHHSEQARENIMTEYEKNFSAKGISINCVEAIKK